MEEVPLPVVLFAEDGESAVEDDSAGAVVAGAGAVVVEVLATGVVVATVLALAIGAGAVVALVGALAAAAA